MGDVKITPSSGCVFCDINVEHPKLICGMVQIGSEDARKQVRDALDLPSWHPREVGPKGE
jgi:hypothetical protein